MSLEDVRDAVSHINSVADELVRLKGVINQHHDAALSLTLAAEGLKAVSGSLERFPESVRSLISEFDKMASSFVNPLSSAERLVSTADNFTNYIDSSFSGVDKNINELQKTVNDLKSDISKLSELVLKGIRFSASEMGKISESVKSSQEFNDGQFEFFDQRLSEISKISESVKLSHEFNREQFAIFDKRMSKLESASSKGFWGALTGRNK